MSTEEKQVWIASEDGPVIVTVEKRAALALGNWWLPSLRHHLPEEFLYETREIAEAKNPEVWVIHEHMPLKVRVVYREPKLWWIPKLQKQIADSYIFRKESDAHKEAIIRVVELMSEKENEIRDLRKVLCNLEFGIACGLCGSTDISTTHAEQKFQYGATNPVMLSAMVPFRKCGECGFEYTDHEGETARQAALDLHLATKVFP
jgi:hypothetical protein